MEVFFDNVEAFFDGFTSVVFAAASHDADKEFVFRDVEDNGGLNVFGEIFGDPFGLPNVAREAVEDEVFSGFLNCLDFFVHDFNDFFVGNKFTFFEDFVELAGVAEDLTN